VIALESGLSLTAHVSGSRRRVAEGERVEGQWDPAKVWILPHDERRSEP